MDPATIETPDGPRTLHVCRDGDASGSAWIDVYEEAFPAGQRQSVDELREMVRQGSMELDETRDETGRIVCLTLTEVFRAADPEFLLACYTATPPSLRSLGIGTLHRRRLVDLLRSEYPDHLGLFSEIESTTEPGLDPATRALRRRRLAFFQRMGVRRLTLQYLFPSFHPDEPPLQGELLWVPFGREEIEPATLRAVLRRVYVEGYSLDPSDPFIDRAIDEAVVSMSAAGSDQV